MADNTRVNELQQKLLQAMDILNAQALNSISFDKTITCTIESDKDKKDGKYEVSDGSRIFTAYSTDTKLRAGESVYVTVPEGNFENQKLIIGKITTENTKPFVFTTPFDTYFPMTENLLSSNLSGELLANSLETYSNNNAIVGIKKLLDTKSNLSFSNYTRLGLKADFKSWIKEAVSGDYGILVEISTTEENIVGTSETTSEDKAQKNGKYAFLLNSSDMYGNPYNFETYYTQELIVPIEQVKGIINEIKISFYQSANFIDKYNEPMPCSEKGYKTQPGTNIYDRDDNGNLQLKDNDTLLSSNLFVKNIELSLGYDISMFDKDYVEIYTQDKNTYRRSTSTKAGEDNIDINQKVINMRWIHIMDGDPVNMSKNQTDTNYEVRWYKYRVGAAAADEYCGVYWERINEATGWTYTFNPDVNKQQEKIKVIIVYEGNTPYRSNEIIFNNEEQLPPSEEAQHIASALNIVCDDGTKGNYFLYGQGCRIKDSSYANVDRVLSCYFDTNNDGEHESLIQDIEGEQENKPSITWIFPNKNTMIELIGKTDEEKEQDTVVRHMAQPTYRIARTYNSKHTNNTIQCIYELNGVVYTTEIDLTFGKAGTMGSDQTLVIDFVGDTVAYSNEDTISFQIQLFDNSGELQDIPPGTVKWEWYCNDELTSEQSKIINKEGNAILPFSFNENNKWKIDKLHILQATIGTLTTYFSIPIKNGGYSHIDGPTEVIYRSDGKPDYSDLPYKLYESGGKEAEGVSWEIMIPETAFGYKYVGKISSNQDFIKQDYYIREEIYITDSETNEKVFDRNEYKKAESYDANTTYYEKILDNFVGSIANNKLQPVSIYIKDAPVYGVKAMTGTGENKTTVWSQPIFVCQNQYPSTVINQWDGKSLVLDEENSAVIAAAVSAGRKNSDNTFSGVIMGDWSSEGVDTDGSISGQTGLYGFHHGDMSYAFKEDGTGFIGKSSMARINFDGSEATIYSAGYKDTINNPGGMMINLYNDGEPFIELKSKVEDGTSSIMRFDTKNSKSEIKMTLAANSEGKSRYIRITNADSNTNPLTIGDDFSVGWKGDIKANSGTIGSWRIKNNNLESDDGNVVLSTEGNGTIKINNNDIIIKGGDRNTKTQITLENNSIIHGGIIEAGTLRSNSDSSFITLQGYIKVGSGAFGYVTANSPTPEDPKGIGMTYGTNKSRVIATGDNAALGYGDDGNYVSVESDYTSMGNGKKIGINCTGTGNSNNVGIWICGNDEQQTHIHIYDIPAENQHGIYARFA